MYIILAFGSRFSLAVNHSQDSIFDVQRTEVCFWALILDIWTFRLLLFNLKCESIVGLFDSIFRF